MPAFGKSSTQYATFEKRHDADGKVWVQAQAGLDHVANTPYLVVADELGPITRALSDVTVYCFIGVAAAAATSGDIVWLQIGGRQTAMITPSLSVAVGHAVSILDGAVADVGSDYTGAAGQFGSAITASATATTLDVMLVPERILTTT